MNFADVVKTIEKLKARTDEYAFSDLATKIETPPILPQQRELTICTPPVWHRSVDTVEDARRLIPQVMGDYFSQEHEDNHMLLIKAAPGTGKTTAAAKVAEDLAAQGLRVGYAGPRHDFYQQVLDKAQKPRWWYEWQPRQLSDEDKKETCRYAPEITRWMNRGYEGMDFCSKICGWDFVNNQCPYHLQKGVDNPIVYIQHQHITLGHPLKFDVIIGDESPTQAFTHDWHIPYRFILPSGMDKTEPLTELLYMMQTIAHNSTHIEGEELIDFLGGPEKVIETCQSFNFIAGSSVLSPNLWQPDDVDEQPYFHLPNTIELLIREANSYLRGTKYAHRVIIHKTDLTLILRRPVSDMTPSRICWLDATGEDHIYQELFQRPVQSVTAHPKMQGKIYQVVSRANGKTSLISSKSGDLTRKSQQLEHQIEIIIKKHGYQSPVVISFQKFVDQSKIFGEDSKIQHTHFYASRGSNEFEYCDAIIVAGTPQPSIVEIAKMAKMVFYNRDEMFDLNKFTSRETPYHYQDENGVGRQYPVSGYWDDEDMQSILRTVREDEIIQAAHRVRPINKPVDIWLLLNLPIAELPPDELITITDLLGSPKGVDAFMFANVVELANQIADKNNGVITLNDFIAIGVNRRTAMKYFDCLTEDDGWIAAKVRISQTGRPRRALQRDKINGLV